MSWLLLAIAITAEIIATSSLKASNGFTRLYPSLITGVGYVISFYCLSLTLRVLPVGVVYAVWSGVGIVAISIIGYLLFQQALDGAAMIGIGLIVAGVLVLNIFSGSVRH
jgi:small multidrug resistance pump